jgi:hypothetical protein
MEFIWSAAAYLLPLFPLNKEGKGQGKRTLNYDA